MILYAPGATGSLGCVGSARSQCRPQPALGMGTNHGFHRILLRASLPFHRGLEERPAARFRRIDRSSVGPLGVDPAHQDQGRGPEPGAGGFLPGHVAAIPSSRAGLGWTLLRGRTLLSLLRRASDAKGVGWPTAA